MQTMAALCVRNMKAFARDRTSLIISLIFPFFFIYVFSAIFKNQFIENPITYMLAGITIATVFDFSLRISASTIDDMVSGFMKEVLVSPVSRLSVASGQFLSSAVISTAQGLIILTIGFFIGLRISSPGTVVIAIFAMIFVGLVCAGFGLFIASKTKSIRTFQVVTMAITMPMTFLSGAYIPLSLLPNELVIIAYFNPMTYAVALFRAIILEKTSLPIAQLINEGLAFQIGNFTIAPFTAWLILLVFGAVFLALSTVSFIKTDFSRINRIKNDAIEW